MVIGGAISGFLTRREPWTTAKWWIASLCACAVAIWAALLVQPLAMLGYIAFAIAWGTATAVDLAEHDLPDVLTLAPIPLFYLLQLPWAITGGEWGAYGSALLGMATTGIILFVLAFINPRGFGLGDVKLGLATGTALGWFGLTTALVGIAAAFILMALISGILLLTKRVGRDSEAPFGPFMVLGVLVAPWATTLLGW